MNNATGHAIDAGFEGLKSAIALMKQAGIQLAGVGSNLSTARTAVFHATPKGRIGMIGAVSGNNNGIASDLEGNMRQSLSGGWGMNPLRLSTWNTVTNEQFQQLKAMRDAIVARRGEIDLAHSNPIPMPRDRAADRVSVFGANFMVGPKIGEYHYEMNREDAEGNLIAMRNTKEYADFAIFTMHVHQMRLAFQGQLQDNYPTDFLMDFTHKLIDNGADMYVGHGNHALQGIEIYKGRPIFYGLGSMAQQQMMTEGSQEGADEIPPGMTPMEADELDLERLRRPSSMIGILATSTYQDGKLVEVRLYPMDLGTDKSRPWSQMGVARTPTPQMAQEILTKVQLYSKPFGTQIAIENGVGVIRISPESIVPVGGELRSKFPTGYRK
jgi:poly-gamma-glutamate synthesis protein (capsule biosynthesis protein)